MTADKLTTGVDELNTALELREGARIEEEAADARELDEPTTFSAQSSEE
jgi:hypothetical protein